MAEFLIVLPVLVMLILGTVQLALLFYAKITLNYATFEAARAGSLENGSFEAIREGLARGMAPLASYTEETGHRAQVEAFKKGRQQYLELFDDVAGLIRIERLSPTAELFNRHGVDGAIPNDNLLYRDPNGGEGKTIQDANLLHLRVTYWHQMEVPFINTLIHKFICCDSSAASSDDPLLTWNEDEELRNCRWQGDPACDKGLRFPLTSVAVMRMQTPAQDSTGFYSP